jgi:hypothetical protein
MSDCFSSALGCVSRFMRVGGDVDKAGRSEGGPVKSVPVSLCLGLFHPGYFHEQSRSWLLYIFWAIPSCILLARTNCRASMGWKPG